MPPSITPRPTRLATAGPAAPAPLPLFANVRLRESLAAEGVAVPAKASGTVVEVLAGGRAYIVEFFAPRHAVVTVSRDLLEPDPR